MVSDDSSLSPIIQIKPKVQEVLEGLTPDVDPVQLDETPNKPYFEDKPEVLAISEGSLDSTNVENLEETEQKNKGGFVTKSEANSRD